MNIGRADGGHGVHNCQIICLLFVHYRHTQKSISIISTELWNDDENTTSLRYGLKSLVKYFRILASLNLSLGREEHPSHGIAAVIDDQFAVLMSSHVDHSLPPFPPLSSPFI